MSRLDKGGSDLASAASELLLGNWVTHHPAQSSYLETSGMFAVVRRQVILVNHLFWLKGSYNHSQSTTFQKELGCHQIPSPVNYKGIVIQFLFENTEDVFISLGVSL